MDKAELLIYNGNKIYYPAVLEGITWETDRSGGSPGKLTFTIINDSLLDFEEGNVVTMKYGKYKVFKGFIFTRKFNSDGTLGITAYDQIRYLKNKHTMKYENKTASEVIKIIAAQFRLNVGIIEDTEWVIPSRIEDDTELIQMIYNALDKSMIRTNKFYVLYDDFGELTLKDIESMKLPLLYDNDTVEDFDYETSIDKNTYNQIRITYDNDETGVREVYMTQDSENINKWGVLQYCEKINKNINGKFAAEKALEWFNKKTNSLSVKNALGDIRVRAGSSIKVKFDIPETPIRKLMVVDKVKHTFKNGEHFMDMSLNGALPMKYFTGTKGIIIDKQ